MFNQMMLLVVEPEDLIKVVVFREQEEDVFGILIQIPVKRIKVN